MVYEKMLEQIIAEDERLIILTAENRAAIRNIPEKFKDRFIDVGIAEQTMIGISAGLALRGRIPVVHALAAFLTMRAFEFIRTDIGIAKLPVKLIGGVPGILSEANGPTHQAIEDISIIRGIPGINIFCPADNEDMLAGLESVLLSPSPYYIRFNNLNAKISHGTFKEGKAEVVKEGSEVTILTYGAMFNQALDAAGLLERDGISVRLVNLRTLKPVDEKVLLEAADTKLIVTIEDHFITGGLFSILSEIFLKNSITAKVLPIAFDNRWFKPALLNDVLEYEKLTPAHLAGRIARKLVSLKRNVSHHY